MNDKLSMPVIGTADISVRKISLKRSDAAELQMYRKVYADTYGEEITLEEIVAALVVSGLKADKKFQKYVKESKDSNADG